MTRKITKGGEFFLQLVLALLCGMVLLFPTMIQFAAMGPNFKGVPIGYIVDSLYYFARINDVVRGHLLIGNPFLWEYRQSWPVAFFVPDWLAALPAFFLPLWQALIANTLLWGIVFVLLAYHLLRRLGTTPLWSAGGAFLTLLVSYLLVMRAVSMQQVFPFFLGVMLLTWRWWQRPNGKWSFVLALFYAASYAIYTYMFQFTAVLLVLLAILKKSSKLLAWFLFFSVPVFFLIYFQTHQPFYWETLSRIGLVHTRLPNVQAFINAGQLLFTFWLLVLVSSSKRQSVTFLLLIGCSLLVVNFSNVITGLELETAIHLSRLIDIWRVCCVILAFSIGFPKKKLVSTLAVISLVSFLPAMIYSGKLIFPKPENDWTKIQDLAAPVAFLDARDPTPQVIWANQTVSRYVPILSKNYILYAWEAHLQLAPSAEMAERFLLSHYFDNFTLQDVKNNLRVYAGVGPSVHQPAIINYASKICPFCIRSTTAEKLLGENYFPNLWQKYQSINDQNLPIYLAKYHVKYFVVDKNRDRWPKAIAWPKIYEDGTYLIYQIPAPTAEDGPPK
ncbi:hypothetical protein HY440_00745 [Candidatus Microgenomates bacterium]|nr:hypothetical protein [Candidatus Microgenomates bacterium]